MKCRTLNLATAAGLLWLSTSLPAAEPTDDTGGGACIPNPTYPTSFGCFLLTAQPVGKLDHPAFWHVETFATRAEADKAKGEHGAVVEEFDKVWLLTIADKGWRSKGGTHVAEIGPLPTTTGRDYTAQFLKAIFKPGMKSRIHRHSGPEAWYTISGATCLETPQGSMVGKAGGPPVIVPQGPPMELTATGTEIRKALVLILHDAAEPHTTLATDWKPKGLCTKK
jgi:hypothetical protein